MKALLPPCLLLTVILALSLWNSSAISADTERWRTELAQADAQAAAGDWAAAGKSLAVGYADWDTRQTFFHIVVRHEEVDGAEAMYHRAEAFLKTEELSEFQAELADLRNQLRLLSEMERLSIKNVL